MRSILPHLLMVALASGCARSEKAEAPPMPNVTQPIEEQAELGAGGEGAIGGAATNAATAPEEPPRVEPKPAPARLPMGTVSETRAWDKKTDALEDLPGDDENVAGPRGPDKLEGFDQGALAPPPPPLPASTPSRDAAATDPLALALEREGWAPDKDGVADERPEAEEREDLAGEDDAKNKHFAREKTTGEAERDERKEEGERTGHRDDARDDGDGKLARGAFTVRLAGEDPALFVPPASTLPRMFYFENTYLGGSAAYAERLRRLEQALSGEARPYEVVRAEEQPIDPPRTEGLALTASVDATHFERARRVFLQVGLRGSSRYGWRRPPLDVVLVIDQPALARGPAFVTAFVVDLLRRLDAADRLGVVLAGEGAPTFLELSRIDTAQQHLANRIDGLTGAAPTGARDLADAMRKAGVMLEAASDDEATVPGTKTLFLLSGEHDHARIAEAAAAAHELTVLGCVTSVFALDAERSEWWQVADAGYGNLHRIAADAFAPALSEEMQSLARVVARLVRVNVRLGKDAKAIRVLGTRVLEQREVEEVKAREKATDINLSKSLGITSDRGEDDDGIQTVIPYFYGDDSHVILIELWVEGPGVVADVTLRYKDMVNLDNATARTSVRLGTRPQPPTGEQLLIARNVRGFELAENLQRASDAVYRNDYGTAVKNLGAAGAMASDTNTLDVQAVEGLKAMVERGDWQNDATRRATLQETLLLSGQRRVGDTGSTPARK